MSTLLKAIAMLNFILEKDKSTTLQEFSDNNLFAA